MTDHRAEGPGENGAPVPRDMPDQQADAGEDPWDVAPGLAARESGTDADDAESGDDAEDGATGAGATDVPDTDEAGTGRQGAPHSGAVHPEHPVPDESSG
ncbi:hypothetical protein J7I94_26725 [Streptomyces sp. ISL-12]|uniref:hypothetical protein n=1 Tax=Streptomyces sp. ISL-12 TaxID=2819177 RepID=UPI001BE7941A|nr:hypothetical protein [Streptomyces sp. ISL-12]MBT2414096.1 hypothetical protein [Streptomyces sp. ISL-12]